MCGRTGLKTVGSCESATTICPPFLTASAASTTPRSSRGPSMSAAPVERLSCVGGVCINTGTIPSKTLREAVLYLSGFQQRGLYGYSYRVKQNITIQDLMFRCHHVIEKENDVYRIQFARNGVDLLEGHASFVDPHTIKIQS